MTVAGTESPESGFWNSGRVVGIFVNDEPSEAVSEFLRSRGFPPGFRALDLGCGGGRNTQLLVARDLVTWACDAHQAMVDATAQRLGSEFSDRVQLADMASLPYRDGFFHVVLASGVFHNAYSLDEMVHAIGEAARVLPRGGEMYVNVFVLGDTPPEEQRITLVDPDQSLYLTDDDGLRMTLAEPGVLRQIFAAAGLKELFSEIYVAQEFTGPRDTYRGWLAKA